MAAPRLRASLRCAPPQKRPAGVMASGPGYLAPPRESRRRLLRASMGSGRSSARVGAGTTCCGRFARPLLWTGDCKPVFRVPGRGACRMSRLACTCSVGSALCRIGPHDRPRSLAPKRRRRVGPSLSVWGMLRLRCGARCRQLRGMGRGVSVRALPVCFGVVVGWGGISRSVCASQCLGHTHGAAHTAKCVLLHRCPYLKPYVHTPRDDRCVRCDVDMKQSRMESSAVCVRDGGWEAETPRLRRSMWVVARTARGCVFEQPSGFRLQRNGNTRALSTNSTTVSWICIWLRHERVAGSLGAFLDLASDLIEVKRASLLSAPVMLATRKPCDRRNRSSAGLCREALLR